MKFTRVFLPALLAISSFAFGQSATAPTEYSFSISGSQTWTDTGVDLAAGDSLTLSAETKSGSSANCTPQGLASTAGDVSKVPLPSAPVGALIARTSDTAAPLLVGTGATLKTDAAGHLFLGINQDAASSCVFAVKVQIAHAPSASPAQSTNSEPATPDATGTASHPDMKTQLSSAAQVWLKGQFGGSSSSQTANAVNGKASGGSANTDLKLPVTDLEPSLRQSLDALPRRVHDHAGNLGDMVNFVIVGSQEQMQAAVDAADWHVADLDSKEAGLKAITETYERKDYLQMPMSHLYLFDRMQDFGYEQAQAFAVVATRHHFRIWKAPFMWNNQTIWVGAATHDIGFEKDIRTGKLTHKIDPDVDAERENLAQGLDMSAKTKSMTYYLPPNPIQEAKNASGGSYHSDGRLLVVFLK